MPPKAKFSKQEIINTAVEITRRKGIAAVTAREVGASLGMSSRPLFTYFDTVEQLKGEVYLFAKILYKKYIENGLEAPIPNLGVGQQYIKFAKDEPELYKLLFLTKPDNAIAGAIDALKVTQDLVRESIMRIYNMDAATADHYFRDLWLIAFSFATLIVTDDCPYSEIEINSIFTEVSLSLCKAFKEVPGLTKGNFDKEAIFRELVKNK